MSSRGKANQRKPVLPNIAAAGRTKTEKSEEASNNGEKSTRGRGRGGNRGRGRGRGGSKATVIVQSEGTFTMGLNDNIPKSNRLNDHGSEEVIGKLEKSVGASTSEHVKRPKAENDEDAKSNTSDAYNDLEWASDDDQDKIELYELVKPAFIADIKKGREMPVVLPQKDESQFRNLVQVTQKSAAKDDSNQDNEDNKPHVTNSRISASRIQSYVKDHANELMLLQLPASLDLVRQEFNTDTSEEKMEVDEVKSQQQPSSSTATRPVSQQKHCLDGLPSGVEIGKLQLLKNGQTRLVIGGCVMDVQKAIPSQMFETIVQTQIFTRPKAEPGTSAQASSSSTPSTSSMTVLGNVGDSFLCTKANKTATLLTLSNNEQPRDSYCRFSGTKLLPPVVSSTSTPISNKSSNIPEKKPKKPDQSGNKITRLLARVRRSSHSSSSSSIGKSPPQATNIPPNDGHSKQLERQNCIRDDSEVDLEAGLGAKENSTDMLTAIDPTFGGKLTPPPLAVRAEIEALNAELQRQSMGQISPTQLSPKKKRSIVSETVPEESSLSIITDQLPHSTIERLSSSSGTTTDSALSSTNDSRRNSSGTGFFSNGNGPAETGFIRPRRSTVTGKLPHTRINKPPLLGTLPNGQSPQMIAGTAGWRTVSVDSQFDDENLSDDDMTVDMRSVQRRLSIDERTLRKANYAILRKSENSIQVVGAFSRNESTAYRNYLQAMTAYDLLPAHGIVLLICSKLSIRKTIHALCSQTSSKAAIATDSESGNYNIFTVSDALHCLQLRRKDKSVAEMSVNQYFETHQPQKRLVVTGEITSVWEVARMFRLNHVHRIPVVRVENFVRTKEVMGICSLRPIFLEIMKMFEKSCSLTPNLHQLTLANTMLGKRKNLATVSATCSCSDAVDKFLEEKISCVPLVNSEDNIVGVLTKNDIINAIAVRGEGAIDEIMDSAVNVIANPSNLNEMLISADASLATAIRQLVSSHHQCLLISQENKLVGVVSYADLMGFLVDIDKN